LRRVLFDHFAKFIHDHCRRLCRALINAEQVFHFASDGYKVLFEICHLHHLLDFILFSGRVRRALAQL